MQNGIADAAARERYNSDITAQSKETAERLKQNVAYDTGALEESIGSNTRKFYGQIDSISFPFLRYGVFIAKGAGRGYGGLIGSSWYNAKGELKTTNPLSLGKMNSGSRQGDDWYGVVIDEEIPKYKKVAIEYYSQLYVNAVQL